MFFGALTLSSVAAARNPSAEGLADACTSCHGLRGHSSGAIPSIGGVTKATLLAELGSFRNSPSPATIMNRIVRGYTDADLEILAEYFSSMKTP
jgi:sulfide dehydrogenase cytochrome subunit